MSENLYPARLKRKRHSCAAVSNKQKRLQCPFEHQSAISYRECSICQKSSGGGVERRRRENRGADGMGVGRGCPLHTGVFFITLSFQNSAF